MSKYQMISAFWKLIIAILVCEVTGILSSFISIGDMHPWFETIKKPSWNPPGYLFGPVWTFLYLLMGISFWLIWNIKTDTSGKRLAMLFFGIQLFLNFWWSLIFFKYHSPQWALVEILLMLLFIFATFFQFYKISKPAAWLLAPYIAWVSFASYLNYTIWILNP